jgi:hypothetical protein
VNTNGEVVTIYSCYLITVYKTLVCLRRRCRDYPDIKQQTTKTEGESVMGSVNIYYDILNKRKAAFLIENNEKMPHERVNLVKVYALSPLKIL